MTTLLGIKTNSGEEAVVLVTDTQVTYGSEEHNKNRKPFYKMANGDFWALGFIGSQWDESRKFYNQLTTRRFKDFTEKDIEQMILSSIQKKRFIEIDTINAEFMRRYDEGESGTMEFLLATNKPKVELYFIDAYGNIYTLDDLDYHEPFIVKSATDDTKKAIINYINEKISGDDIGSGDRIDLELALNLAKGAMQKVETDIYSSGPIDITILTKNGIFNYGRQIKKAIEDAENAAFSEIIKKHIPKESEMKKDGSRSPDSN
ncbi:MAG: hypothetical protein AABW84_01320 [Nanoarchaeota archaeon]